MPLHNSFDRLSEPELECGPGLELNGMLPPLRQVRNCRRLPQLKLIAKEVSPAGAEPNGEFECSPTGTAISYQAN